MADETPTETAPPAIIAETGVAMDGDYPHNHRLRAEALAKAGEASDPDGIVTDELIADAGERIEREEEANSVDGRSKSELETMAAAEGVDLSEAKNNGERAKLIEQARAESATSTTETTAPPPPVSDESKAGDESKGA